MKDGGRYTKLMRAVFLSLILAGSASIATAAPLLTCNNGTNTTCTFWVDLFSGTLSQSGPIDPNTATTENANFNGTVAIPQWDTASNTPGTELSLTGIQFVIDWKATGSVSVTNDDADSRAFTNAVASTPISFIVNGNTINVAALTAGVSNIIGGEQPVLDSTSGNESAYYSNQVTILTPTLGATQAQAVAAIETQSHCLSSVSNGGQNGSAYNPGTMTCTNAQIGAVPNNVTYAAGSQTGTSGPFAGVNIGAFQSFAPVDFSANVATGLTSAVGSQGGCTITIGPLIGTPCLNFAGTGTAGAILEVTYIAQLQPIPEPITLVLVGAALLAIGLAGRKRLATR